MSLLFLRAGIRWSETIKPSAGKGGDGSPSLYSKGGDFPLSPYPRTADRMLAASFSPDLAILPLFSLLCVTRHLLDTDLTKK